MKLRILFRKGMPDYEGRLAEYSYSTCVVEIPDDDPCFKISHDNFQPEVIGGEWLEEKNE